MNKTEQSKRTLRYRVLVAGLAGLAIVGTSAFTHAMMMRNTKTSLPPASEFGLGPRTSAQGFYTVTLQPIEPLRPRQMQTVRVIVNNAEGLAVDGAAITVDGGMPQHGHGLPTRPRVTNNFGNGIYEIEGVRFNMGGWWEFKLAITSPAGQDSVTFNINL